MTARSFVQGHRIAYRNREWVYADTGENVKVPRPCAKCKCFPTPEGHDACLGHIPGAKYACCGHGANPGYVLYEDGKRDKLPVRS